MRSSTGSFAIARKSFEVPDEIRCFERGTLDVVTIGAHRITRATFHPGWIWSEHSRPTAQTHLCESEHVGYVLSGRMVVRMNDGRELEYRAGDIMAVKPYHDAWVAGDEPCVVLHWSAVSS